jgi:DNA polymerase III subunit beta
MKFICDKNTLAREIAVAQEIISSRNVLSILSNVLLEADNNTLTIKATDLKVGFETHIPVDVSESGSTTVFCDKFLGILRSLPDGEVEFEQQDSRLIIRPTTKKIDFQLKSIASDKYPELQSISEDQYFSMPQKDIIEMITQTVFAVSDDETRYFMNGVYFEKQDTSLVMVATDGRRLSYIRKEVSGTISDFSPVIIPPKVLGLVKKLSSGEGEVKIAVSEKYIFVRFDNQHIFSNLIDGQFPNYNRVIPEQQPHTIRLDKKPLLEALRRVSLLVEQKSRRIYLTVNEDIILLKSEESEIGSAKEEIPCDYKGSETSIALNYLYLEEPLKVIEEEKISILFSDESKAITVVSEPQKEYLHIVMPMQID